MERCDVDALLKLNKDTLITFNQAFGLPYSNKNKEQLSWQLLEFKGCYCNLRKGLRTACRYVPTLAMTAALVATSYYIDKYAGEKIGPYGEHGTFGGYGIESKGYIRDINDLKSRFQECFKADGTVSSACMLRKTASLAAEGAVSTIGGYFSR